MTEYTEDELAEIEKTNAANALAAEEKEKAYNAKLIVDRAARDKAVEDAKVAAYIADQEQRSAGVNLDALQKSAAFRNGSANG